MRGIKICWLITHTETISGTQLDIELLAGQTVAEGSHQGAGDEVEDEAESDGDGQGWQCLLEDGQQQQGEAQALQHTGSLSKKQKKKKKEKCGLPATHG